MEQERISENLLKEFQEFKVDTGAKLQKLTTENVELKSRIVDGDEEEDGLVYCAYSHRDNPFPT